MAPYQQTSCSVTASCQAGQYCGTTGTCIRVIERNQACSPNASPYQCGFQSTCFVNVTTSNATCQPLFSIQNGVQLTPYTPASVCMSNYTVVYIGNSYCMPAPVSTTSLTTGVAPGTLCTYNQWLNPMNFSATANSSTSAVCGYASNGMAYCDQRMGDGFYSTVIQNIIVSFSRMDLKFCNPMSNVLQCDAFLQQVPATFVSNYKKAMMLVMPGGNALYSQNDQCTMADLTSTYWMYSSASKLMGSVLVIIVLIQIL